MENLGIYIHIPFCKRKCPYCNFYSVEYTEELAERYVDSLCKEIKSWGSVVHKTVDSIYFGGGSPNLLKPKFLNKILSYVSESFIVSNCETTIELNPSCHTYTDFTSLKNVGVNRLSFGAQSINSSELKILGRDHSARDVKLCINKARFAGIENISLDFIIGIPSQDTQRILNSLNFSIKNDIPHLSVYILKIEQGTPYFKNLEKLQLPTEDQICDFYLLCDEFLSSRGYEHYEISNFCKPGKESRHNLKYWNCDEYLGFGPSAHSFIDGKRWYYPNSISEFMPSPNLIKEGLGGTREEYAMLKLRLKKGLENEEYKLKFHQNIPSEYYEKARLYTDLGYAELGANSIRLTPRGFLLSNSLISNILY